MTEHLVLLDGEPLRYSLRYSDRRRTIGLTVDHDGLTVVAPRRTGRARIEAAIVADREWISRQLARWRGAKPRRCNWQDGDLVYYLGEPLALKPSLALLGHGAHPRRGSLHVFAPDHAAVPGLVIGWYRGEAERHYAARVAAISPGLGVRARRIVLSDARRQWGSCNTRGDVRINWRLMQMRPALIDYVVAHELAHLRHMNHGPEFWATVESVCPQHRELRRELNDSARYHTF